MYESPAVQGKPIRAKLAAKCFSSQSARKASAKSPPAATTQSGISYVRVGPPREVVVAITAGQLNVGPWEQIFYGEFDGKRRKRALIKIIGE